MLTKNKRRQPPTGHYGLRMFLWEQRAKFTNQEEMAAFISKKSGIRVSQPTLSCWLSGSRYPEPPYRYAIRSAFNVAEDAWERILMADNNAKEKVAEADVAARHNALARYNGNNNNPEIATIGRTL